MARTIVYLIQGLNTGGLERVVLHLATAMHRAGRSVTICCYDDLGPLADEARRDGLGVELLRRQAGLDLGYILNLACALRRLGAHVLHMHNSTALFYGTLAARLARVPVRIYTEHDGVFPRTRRAAWCNRRLVKRLSRAVAVSEAVRGLWCRNDRIDPGRVMVIPNGVPANPRAAQPVGQHAPGEFRVGYVGRLSREKGPDILLEALAIVRKRFPHCRLTMIGEGPLRADVERQAGQLGGGVEFLGYRPDVADLMKTLDLLVLPSRTEGLPLALLEAMAAGLPAVAANVGGVGEAMEAGITGLLAPSENPQALADAIESLVADPARCDTMGKAALERFRQRFSIERMVESYAALYDRP